MKRLLAVAALLGAVTCAGAQGAASGPYLGTWTARLSKAQMINQGFDPRLAGTFRLVLRRNGTYTTFNSFDGTSRGRFSVAGTRIAFSHDVGCAAGGSEGKGVYVWAIAHGALRLNAARIGSDPCGGRWQTLTYPVWRRLESRL
jgi:hypothetical protein